MSADNAVPVVSDIQEHPACNSSFLAKIIFFLVNSLHRRMSAKEFSLSLGVKER